MQEQQLKQALERLQYRVIYRATGWYECLVANDEESWTGRGTDSAHALADVLRQMFPSKAARTTFEAFIQEPPKVSESPSQESSKTPEPTEAPKAAEPEKKRSFPPLIRYERKDSQISPKPTPVKTSIAVAPPPPAPEPEISLEEAKAYLQSVLEDIETSREDLAVMASAYQRLNIASWIFQARSVEEQFPKRQDISETVHDIARRLTDICKDFWPGSVQALQVYTPPTKSLVGLTKHDSTPTTWGEAADILEEAVEDLAQQHGVDAYGWADFAATQPPPTDADEIVNEAVRLIESALGDVKQSPDDKNIKQIKIMLPEQFDDLVKAGSLLRWARPRCSDQILWGYAMGKLRWASKFKLKGATKLAQTVDPKTKPTKSWAETLDRDPEVRRKRRLRARVLATTPVKEWTLEQVMDWLTEAFPVLTNPQIAKMLEPVHSLFLELEIQDFADTDRNIRSRFKKLQKIVSAGEDFSNITLPSVDKKDLEEKDAEEEDESKAQVTTAERLLENVRQITSGKKMLFVSNRDDQILRKALERDLDCEVVMKDGGSSRKIQSAIEGVNRGSYDMILMATGFNNHTADALLSRAAKSLDIPYVRVNKGRPSATARAIARAFNVHPSRNQADTGASAQA